MKLGATSRKQAMEMYKLLPQIGRQWGGKGGGREHLGARLVAWPPAAFWGQTLEIL